MPFHQAPAEPSFNGGIVEQGFEEMIGKSEVRSDRNNKHIDVKMV